MSISVSSFGNSGIRDAFESRFVPFIGRSYQEYLHFFGLQTPALKGRSILDVGAGPSGFVAGCRLRGIEGVAVDPEYALPLDALRRLAYQDFAALRVLLAASPERFDASRGGGFAALIEERQAALEDFLDDYASGRAAGRYRLASLPRLPFGDGQFDDVLNGHCLFLHARYFGDDFVQESFHELLRVARRRVLIYPLVGMDGVEYPQLDAMLASLDPQRFVAVRRPVFRPFYRAGGTFLEIRKIHSAPS